MYTDIVPACSDVPSGGLARMSRVLDSFDGPGRLTLTQVVSRTGLPRSSAHRMLESLVEQRWLHREANEYELGGRLIELGATAVHQNRLRQAGAPIVRRLHELTGYVVHFGILDGADVIYLDKLGGRLAPQLPTRIGGRYPAHSSATGKALLACSPSDDSELKSHPELQAVRETGLAYETHRFAGGVGSIATPVGEVGDVSAAISICGPTHTLPFDRRHVAPLHVAARAMQKALKGLRP